MGIIVNAGSRDEAADQQGMAHFIEHLIFKGSPMKVVISAVIAAFAFISVPALAAADKVAAKVDCKDAKNKDHADCKKK